MLLSTLVAICGSAVQAADPAPRVEASLTFVVNLPAYRLDAVAEGRIVASYPVAIGAPAYPTPQGEYVIRTIELNPSWTPPESPWARGRSAQPPGPGNPMGRAKMLLAGSYYLHGTADSASIGGATSHGCIRVANRAIIALAELALETGLPSLGDSARGSLLATRRQHAVRLTDPVGVTVRYDLLEIVGDSLLAHPDIYRRRTEESDRVAQALLECAAWPRRIHGDLAARLLDAAVAGTIATRLADAFPP